jgi:hypothetical protein
MAAGAAFSGQDQPTPIRRRRTLPIPKYVRLSMSLAAELCTHSRSGALVPKNFRLRRRFAAGLQHPALGAGRKRGTPRARARAPAQRGSAGPLDPPYVPRRNLGRLAIEDIAATVASAVGPSGPKLPPSTMC